MARKRRPRPHGSARLTDLTSLASGPPLDAVIIGGGINGCAVARELAGRGKRVALFEKDDFGFGTTWRSTKLIHGGLRYLEHGDLRLVFESLRERAWLLRTRPHLVRPMRFLLPELPWTRRPAWQLRAGLALYDLLALYRAVPGHRRLSDDRLHELAPSISSDTHGGFSFFDARATSPERLVLELALEAKLSGAVVRNHTTVAAIATANGAVSGVIIESGDERVEVRSAAVINAAGPWVDAVNRLAPRPPGEVLGVTRGSHIVVQPRTPFGRDAIFSTARSDGRVFFAVPQGALLQVGTTDDRYEGHPDDARPTSSDITYLLAEANELLPGLELTEADVCYTYTGLRPLERVKGGPEAAISRRHAVIRHDRLDGPRGLYSVIGGKLSTFRPLAREAADAIGAKGRAAWPMFDEKGASGALAQSDRFPEATRRRLRNYGPALSAVLRAGEDPLAEGGDGLTGEVRHAVIAELASTLSDILLRRTGLGWGPLRGLDVHHAAATIAASLLDWDGAEEARQVAAYERDVARHLPTPQEISTPPPQQHGDHRPSSL